MPSHAKQQRAHFIAASLLLSALAAGAQPAPAPASSTKSTPITPKEEPSAATNSDYVVSAEMLRAIEALQAKVLEQKNKVDAAALALRAFMNEHLSGNRLDRQRDTVTENLKAADRAVQRAVLLMDIGQERTLQIILARKGGADPIALPFIAGHALIVELQQLLAKQRQQLAALTASDGAADPRTIAAQNSVTALQLELARATNGICAQTEAEFQAARQNRPLQLEAVERAKEELRRIDRLAPRYRELEEEFLTQNQILLRLVARTR